MQFFHYSAGGAELDALAAAVALAAAPLTRAGNNVGTDTAVVEGEHVLALHLAAGLDAAEAFDAFGAVEGEHRRAVIEVAVHQAGDFRITTGGRVFQPVSEDQIAQFVGISAVVDLVLFR